MKPNNFSQTDRRESKVGFMPGRRFVFQTEQGALYSRTALLEEARLHSIWLDFTFDGTLYDVPDTPEARPTDRYYQPSPEYPGTRGYAERNIPQQVNILTGEPFPKWPEAQFVPSDRPPLSTPEPRQANPYTVYLRTHASVTNDSLLRFHELLQSVLGLQQSGRPEAEIREMLTLCAKPGWFTPNCKGVGEITNTCPAAESLQLNNKPKPDVQSRASQIPEYSIPGKYHDLVYGRCED